MYVLIVVSRVFLQTIHGNVGAGAVKEAMTDSFHVLFNS